MSRNHEFGSQDPVAGDKSADTRDMNDKARQTLPNSLWQISEGEELTPSKSPDEEADEMHGEEKEQNDETPLGDVVEEPIYEMEQDTERPSLQSNVSSFAVPTKASEAKKNEKVKLAQFVKKPSLSKELPGWPGSAMQLQPASVPVRRRPSPKRRSVTSPTSPEDYAITANHSLQVRKYPGTRIRTFGSVASDEFAEEEGIGKELEEPLVLKGKVVEEELPEEQTQVEEEEARREEQPSMQEDKELEEVEGFSTQEEPLEHHVKEPEVEPEASQEQTSPLTKDSTVLKLQDVYVKGLEVKNATPKGQAESMLRGSTEEDGTGSVAISTDPKNIALGKIAAEEAELQAALEKAETQRDEAIRQCETVQQDLQTVKDDAEKLKRKNEKLVTQLCKRESLIAARNAREPNLPALEVVEAENKRLRVAVDKKEKERSDANACCENLDDQLRDAQEELMNQQTSIKDLCEIIDLVSQRMSQGVDIPVPQHDELSESLAQASEIESLQIKITQLIGTFGEDLKKWRDKNGELERQITDQESEMIRLKKAMDFQQAELLNHGLQSPMRSPAMQIDLDAFKQCYERERQKRKEAEQELTEAEKLVSYLYLEKEKLQSDFTKAQEELANLRPKADKLEQDAKEWKEDSEEKRSQLEERTRAFETSTDRQKQETLRYIKDYYIKTNDEAHWEVQGLQKKLAALEEERATLKRAFEQAKVENARLGDGVAKLVKRNKTRDAHIGKIQQVFMRGGEFPSLPDNDASSPSPTYTTSSLAHPLDRASRLPLIPRCHLPTAIKARDARVSAYKQELQTVREQELFNVSVKPSISTKKNNGVGRNDIMEKVRGWKMGSSYPPRKLGWGELRRRGAWERWDGENWAKEFARGKDVDILKKRGLWKETWL